MPTKDTPAPIIKVSHLKKTYGRLTAVDDISFEVFEGEIFGLLGPNGAGKTTTLEIMETLRPASDGDVSIFGYEVRKHKDVQVIKQMIGIQLQQSGFYPNLNLTEILHMFSDLYNKGIDSKALLRLVDLEDKARVIFRDLSGGQKQRFSIATTLINTPKVIFLDEPSTGLDPKARRNLWKIIRDIRDRGTTVIITTHYMDEAEELCDRVAIVDHGKIVALDTPDQLIDTLIEKGFRRSRQVKEATLEDVFLALTGHGIEEGNGNS